MHFPRLRFFRCFFLITGFSVAVEAQGGAKPVSSEVALERLKQGNQRFVAGKPTRRDYSQQSLKTLAGGQAPFAVIIGCSDSRVPNEIIFDQGLGDLFIVRTAGQVSSYASWGSIEFAVSALHTKLIVVLGHTHCGAVGAACRLPEVPGHIVALINSIKPAAQKASAMPGDLVSNAVKVNVALQVSALRNLEPVLAKKSASGEIKIVGGVYDLETGIVTILDEEFIQRVAK